ncbi:MAG: VWA domain-containing protein [Bacillota bacterium]|nr:VWA domain-containing protein [Bacillota bacterium]
MISDEEALNKWRLILGKYSKNNISFSGDSYIEMENLLDYIYGREYGESSGVRRDNRSGGREGSQLTVPSWINKIRELFPKNTVEILEKHALEKYNLTELLTDKEVLEKLEPSKELLKSILSLKHMMKGEVLDTARKIVKTVADQIKEQFEKEIRESIMGRINKNSSGGLKTSRNLDFKKTINKNLKNYNLENNMLYAERVYFNKRTRIYNPWHIIIAVDESGSMLDSVIHSAVMAGIFKSLPMLKTKLIIFDTNVVDLTDYIDDPVETLMSVQLGGGTSIQKALAYGYTLIEQPKRSIFVLISDLFEGGNYKSMYSRAKDIIESGAKLIVLTALDEAAVPTYDKNAALILSALGAEVAALTPEELAKWIAKIIS